VIDVDQKDVDLAIKIGNLEGKVDALGRQVGGLEQGQREARIQGAKEHAEVRRDFKAAVAEIRNELVGRLNRHGEELDDLQESRAGWRMIARVIVIGSSVSAAAAAIYAVASPHL